MMTAQRCRTINSEMRSAEGSKIDWVLVQAGSWGLVANAPLSNPRVATSPAARTAWDDGRGLLGAM